MNIDIKYKSLRGEQKAIRLAYDKDVLSTCEYFKGLFDATDCGTSIDIDLSFVRYLKKRHIVLGFKLQFEDWAKLDHLLDLQQNDPQLHIIFQKETKTCDYDFEINLGLKNLNISQVYTIATITDYLAFDKTKIVLTKCLNNYCSVFDYKQFTTLRAIHKDKPLNSDNSFLNKLKVTLSESYTLYVSIGTLIDAKFYKKLEESIYYVHIGEFAANLYKIFLAFSSLGMMNQFDKIIKVSNDFVKENNRNLFDIKKQQAPYNKSDLRGYNWADMYNFIKSNSGLVAFNCDEYINIYKYYDLIEHVNGKDLFDCINVPDFDESQVNNTIIPYDDAVIRFKKETNGIFNDMDWDEIYIFGTFMYKLINNLPIENSVLYVTCMSTCTYQYVRHYLSSLDVYCYHHENKCHYIVRGLLFDIIVQYDEFGFNYFDWNCIIYDGTTFKTSMHGLILLKYKICYPINNCNLFDMVMSGVLFDKRCSISKTTYVSQGNLNFEKVKNSKYAKSIKNRSLVEEVWGTNISNETLIEVIQRIYEIDGIYKSIPKHAYCVKEYCDSGLITYFGGIIEKAKVSFYDPEYVIKGDCIELCNNEVYLVNLLERLSLENTFLVEVDSSMIEQLNDSENIKKIKVYCKVRDGKVVMSLYGIIMNSA